jgi:hypothetical protein
MEFYVYQLRVENEEHPFYIGKSFVGSKRYIEHCYDANSSGRNGKLFKSKKIRKAWKSGLAFMEEVIATFPTEELALLLEMDLITQYGRRDNDTGILCNHTNGGERGLGKVVSDETRQKMSKSKMGNKINVGRKRLDIRDRCGKPLTMYTSDGTKEREFSSLQECADFLGLHKATVGGCASGKVRSCVLDRDGTKHQVLYGVDLPETIPPFTKNVQNKFGRIAQYHINGTHIADYDSVVLAANSTGIDAGMIRSVILGKLQTAGKFFWKQI